MLRNNRSKVVLVTGGSSGIGKETAKKIMDTGYTVHVAARRFDRIRDLEGLGATGLRMDITKDEDVVGVVNQINAEKGGIDILYKQCRFRHVRGDGGHLHTFAHRQHDFQGDQGQEAEDALCRRKDGPAPHGHPQVLWR